MGVNLDLPKKEDVPAEEHGRARLELSSGLWGSQGWPESLLRSRLQSGNSLNWITTLYATGLTVPVPAMRGKCHAVDEGKYVLTGVHGSSCFDD